MISLISLILVIIGAVNWLFVGIFQLDLVATVFGGSGSVLSVITYIIIGLAGLWLIGYLVRVRADMNTNI
ncbi:MAG: DUF378 domain-containing protein [Firmicutes bacterium]|nr:DUF378 domain-containing protein [Bacillota bacterium]